MRWLLLLALIISFGCAAKFHIGPGEYGWIGAEWDVCGYEGGVKSNLSVMGTNSWTLGCSDPVVESEEDEEE